MKRLVLAAAFLGASTLAVSAQSIGGTYSVQGTNHAGGTYTGTATIEIISDSTCSIVWDTGGTVSDGICMRYGVAFSAAYIMGDSMGLVIYEVMKDGTLQGVWTIAGVDGGGTEVLTPQ